MTRRAVLLLTILAACGSGDDPAVEGPTTSSSMLSPQGVVSVQNSSFSPPTVTVAPGQKVVWTFRDSFAHTATAEDGSFDSANKSNGATFEHTFPSPGTFRYRCDIHPAMTGTVTVG